MATDVSTIRESAFSGVGITLRLPTGDETCSDEEFTRLFQANPELNFERNADGSILIMNPPGSESGRQNHRIAVLLGNWCDKEGSGVAFDSSSHFRLPNDAIRSPDASWVLLERWLAIPWEDRLKAAPIAPDFVIELRSPSDKIAGLRKKMKEYIEQGVRLAWLIDPFAKIVEIYRPDTNVIRLEGVDSVNGDPELPGFVMDLKQIWVTR